MRGMFPISSRRNDREFSRITTPLNTARKHPAPRAKTEKHACGAAISVRWGGTVQKDNAPPHFHFFRLG